MARQEGTENAEKSNSIKVKGIHHEEHEDKSRGGPRCPPARRNNESVRSVRVRPMNTAMDDGANHIRLQGVNYVPCYTYANC